MIQIERSLWGVEFLSNVGKLGTGIVTLNDNIISGGGSLYYYIGRYIIDGQKAFATITVTKYAAGESVFGSIAAFNLELKGIFQSNYMSLTGVMIENPQFTVNINLKKLQNLT
ncbi:GrlR family regulatory protein [Pectinatus sottacetonis]|uniref:GrlR family regulatory protein n=1 Tax=Pectinatus sottacetonis TaxID=1002795 RepID=UPI0018C577E3|nr:GrlR family regulatory protein [Pectinatus sottacetonis]